MTTRFELIFVTRTNWNSFSIKNWNRFHDDYNMWKQQYQSISPNLKKVLTYLVYLQVSRADKLISQEIFSIFRSSLADPTIVSGERIWKEMSKVLASERSTVALVRVKC